MCKFFHQGRPSNYVFLWGTLLKVFLLCYCQAHHSKNFLHSNLYPRRECFVLEVKRWNKISWSKWLQTAQLGIYGTNKHRKRRPMGSILIRRSWTVFKCKLCLYGNTNIIISFTVSSIWSWHFYSIIDYGYSGITCMNMIWSPTKLCVYVKNFKTLWHKSENHAKKWKRIIGCSQNIEIVH